MALRTDVSAEKALYEDGVLIVFYKDGKRVLIRSISRNKRAKTYDVSTLHTVGVNEIFNCESIDAVSFRNCDKCDSMNYLEMRPWVLNVKRCTDSNRCGLNGHVLTNFKGCCL